MSGSSEATPNPESTNLRNLLFVLICSKRITFENQNRPKKCEQDRSYEKQGNMTTYEGFSFFCNTYLFVFIGQFSNPESNYDVFKVKVT